MNRMTKRGTDGIAYYPACFEEPCAGIGCTKDICEVDREICEQLCMLEEEQEKREAFLASLLRPGQTVWLIERDEENGDVMREDVIYELTLSWDPGAGLSLWYSTKLSSFSLRDIGKTAFAVKTDAERVLVNPEEVRNEPNDG